MVAGAKEEQPTHQQLRNDINVVIMAQRSLETSMTAGFTKLNEEVAAIRAEVGSTDHDERGELIGTGIAGNLARLRKKVDDRFRLQDGWIKYGSGALAGISLSAIVIWWLIHDKLELIFKG